MKKILLLSVVLMLIMSMVAAFFAGCKAEEAAPVAEEAAPVVEEEAPVVEEEAAPLTLRLAETHPEDYPTTLADKEFARLVNEATNGRITIEVFANKILGEEKAAIEHVQIGAIDFTRVSISPVSAFVPAVDALQLPYMYRDADHMWKVLKGEIGEEFLLELEVANLVGLCYFDGGTRNFYTREKVEKAEDMKGLKIRVQEAPLMVGMVEALGGIAVPLPFGDVYSALQTGTIDGAENNWPSYYSTGHYEHAPFYIVDEHTKVPEVLMMSKSSFDKLSKEDVEIIKKAAKDSVDFQIELWKAEEVSAEEAVKAEGAIITTISAEEKQKFMDAMQPLYDVQSDAVKEAVEKIKAVQ
jgi:tripartite ATP-independent transporter DctP family solute receptor